MLRFQTFTSPHQSVNWRYSASLQSLSLFFQLGIPTSSSSCPIPFSKTTAIPPCELLWHTESASLGCHWAVTGLYDSIGDHDDRQLEPHQTLPHGAYIHPPQTVAICKRLTERLGRAASWDLAYTITQLDLLGSYPSRQGRIH